MDTSFYVTNLDKQRLRRNVDLKIQTLLRVAQEQAFRTICVKHHIVRSVVSLVCGMCEEKGDTVDHIVSGCKKVAQKEQTTTHQIDEAGVSDFMQENGMSIPLYCGK